MLLEETAYCNCKQGDCSGSSDRLKKGSSDRLKKFHHYYVLVLG